MKTHQSNQGKINKDIGKITLDWLDKYKIEYDEIYFGKPWANIYIDDNGFNYDVQLQESMEDPMTGGVTTMLQYRDIQLHFAREETIIIITNSISIIIMSYF